MELIAEVMGSEVDIISDKKRFKPDNSEVEQLYADIGFGKKNIWLATRVFWK